MKILERYPKPSPQFNNTVEGRLADAYWNAIAEYDSLVGHVSQYIVPKLVDDKLVPAFDASNANAVQTIYEQEGDCI